MPWPGVGVMIQWSKLLPVEPTSHMGTGKAVDDSPNVWAPATFMEDPDEAPGFDFVCAGHCCHLGREPVAGKPLSLTALSLYLCNIDMQINQ